MNDDGSLATRIAVVPVASGTVIDNWTTLGMRGTASNDCEYTDVFVPSHHTYTRADVAHYDSPLYHPPQNAILLSWTLAAGNALGMARGALDAFHELATGSGTTNSPALLRDRSYVQVTYGECEAMHDAARTYVLDAVNSLWDAQVKQFTRPVRPGHPRPSRHHPCHPPLGGHCGQAVQRRRNQRDPPIRGDWSVSFATCTSAGSTSPACPTTTSMRARC